MTTKRALSLARKHLGPLAWVRDRGSPTSQETRSWASAQRRAHPRPVAPSINEWAEDATIGQFRAAVAKYQRDYKAWKKRDDELLFRALNYQYEVGKDHEAYRQILGHGDSWEEALRNVGVPLP